MERSQNSIGNSDTAAEGIVSVQGENCADAKSQF